MVVHSKWRGWPIRLVNNEWIYNDNNKCVSQDKYRRCGFCKKPNNDNGYDACLGKLPNIKNACCGHGIVKDAYVQFYNGDILNGNEAMEWIRLCKTKTQKVQV